MADKPRAVPEYPQERYEMGLPGRVAGSTVEGTANAMRKAGEIYGGGVRGSIDALKYADKAFSPLTRGLGMAVSDAASSVPGVINYLKNTYGTWGGLSNALDQNANYINENIIGNAHAAELPAAPQVPGGRIPGAGEVQNVMTEVGGVRGWQGRGSGYGDTLVNLDAIDPTGELRRRANATPTRVFAPERARYTDETANAMRERVPAARRAPRGPSDYETGVREAQTAAGNELTSMGYRPEPQLITYQPMQQVAAQVPPEQHITNLIRMLQDGNPLERLTAAYQLKQYNEMAADQRRMDREEARDFRILERQRQMAREGKALDWNYYQKTFPYEKQLREASRAASGGEDGSGMSIQARNHRLKIHADLAKLEEDFNNETISEDMHRRRFEEIIANEPWYLPWVDSQYQALKKRREGKKQTPANK